MLERDLRQQTLELLSSNTFREPTTEERKRLGSIGYDIVLSTGDKPLAVVVAENQDHFSRNELVGYVDARPQLKRYTPPALTVALRSEELFLSDSFSKSQAVQLQLHEKENQFLQALIPDARNIMLPASTDAQLDLAYFKKTGRVLFEGRFARALDITSGVRVACVGRDRPGDRLDVYGWQHVYVRDVIGALSAVVFIFQK